MTLLFSSPEAGLELASQLIVPENQAAVQGFGAWRRAMLSQVGRLKLSLQGKKKKRKRRRESRTAERSPNVY